jgi:hypothetical protein
MKNFKIVGTREIFPQYLNASREKNLKLFCPAARLAVASPMATSQTPKERQDRFDDDRQLQFNYKIEGRSHQRCYHQSISTPA